jgi:hypothetical protein
MTTAQILREDLLRAERRKNEPFRKRMGYLQYLHLDLNFYKMKILLYLSLELIFCSMYPKTKTK